MSDERKPTSKRKSAAKATSSERFAAWVQTVPRKAVFIGTFVGAVVGLGLGAITLNVIGCRREAAREREQQQLESDWRAEQARIKAEELESARRWEAAQKAGS